MTTNQYIAPYSYSFDGRQWKGVDASSEQDAADIVAAAVGSTCPVPGAYRAGRSRAVQL